MTWRYLELAKFYMARDTVTLMLFLLALGLVFFEHVLETTTLPFVKVRRAVWIKSFWTLLIILWISIFLSIAIWRP